MSWLRWIAIVLALFEAGWMTFDGTRAFVVGDYVTPTTGEYAGQLGPWTKLVSAVGIEPRSSLMKAIFVVYGVAWLVFIVCYALGYEWAWWAMLLAATGTLWYLWIGTAASLIIIALLLISAILNRA
jgi:hypothetical protein